MIEDHQSVANHVLRVGTIVEIEVETVVPMVQSFTIQREVPLPPVVFDSTGKRTELKPTDIIESVEVFWQHELTELANDSERIAELVKRFNGSGGDAQELVELRERLQINRKVLERAEDKYAELEEEQAQAARLEEQLAPTKRQMFTESSKVTNGWLRMRLYLRKGLPVWKPLRNRCVCIGLPFRRLVLRRPSRILTVPHRLNACLKCRKLSMN